MQKVPYQNAVYTDIDVSNVFTKSLTFIEGVKISMQTSFTIIGNGRVGRLFWKLSDKKALLVPKRELTTQKLENVDGPIIAAVHNSNLDEILEHIPSHRWNDLVFVQGGMILPWLEEKGISDFTLALLYLSAFVDTNGEPQVIDGGGKTVITGKWSSFLSVLLKKGAVKSSVVDFEEYKFYLAEKMLWVSIFWLLCQIYGLTCGEIVEKRPHELMLLFSELYPLALSITGSDSMDLGEDMKSMVFMGLCEYSLKLYNVTPSFEMAISEFSWRNGWFLCQEKTNYHIQLLSEVGLP